MQIQGGQSSIIVDIQPFNGVAVCYDGFQFGKIGQVHSGYAVAIEIQILQVRAVLQAGKVGDAPSRAVYVLHVLGLHYADLSVFVVIEERQEVVFQVGIGNIDAAVVEGYLRGVLFADSEGGLLCGILHPEFRKVGVAAAVNGFKCGVAAHIQARKRIARTAKRLQCGVLAEVES